MSQRLSTASFKELLGDIMSVLQDADSETQVLKTDIPVKFKEKDSMRILDSLNDFVARTPTYKTTTITKKVASKDYTTFYQLYHDIKVAASTVITVHKVGSPAYKNIDFFYKFATELLMRESSLHHTALFNFGKGQSSELESQVGSDFEKISQSYSSSNGEVISYMSEITDPGAANTPSYLYGSNQPPTVKQPLFTSLTGKSELDSRLTIVPDAYSLAKVIPLPRGNGAASGQTYGSLDTVAAKIPPPANKPTTILDNFVHLTWYILSAPEWLTYKGKVLKPPVSSSLLKSQNGEGFRMVSINNESVRSFAPVYDSKGSGVPDELKSNVWLNQVGLNQIAEYRKEYFRKLGVEEQAQPIAEPKPVVKEEADDDFTINTEHQFLDSYTKSKPIELENVLKWDPVSIAELDALKHDEVAKSAQQLQQIISRNLLQLNKLRQERYLKGDASNLVAPSLKEKALHKKVLRLLTLVIEKSKLEPADIPVAISKKIPVLTTEYSGTLPAIAHTRAKSQRLPTIRGPYKKKNRI